MAKELFNPFAPKLGDHIRDVELGKIGLPDLQRPFVWKDNKVRDLLDSIMKGYPIGYIMLWSSPDDYTRKGHIGLDEKAYKQPEKLVIDGQQRLTALLAALKGVPVKDKDYKNRSIKISFNPLTSKFEVWTAAYNKNPEWISVISDCYKRLDEDKYAAQKILQEYIKRVTEARMKESKPELTEEERFIIEQNINELFNLTGHSIPTLEIYSTASEEEVADIFVRVNSGGQNLTEKNFIETLLAVYDNDVHSQIDQFCEQSRIVSDKTSYNRIIDVSPGHLIRVAVGYGFKRARLKYAYMLLRGKDLETGKISNEERENNLNIFKNALNIATDLNNWHSFINLFHEVGYMSGDYVASENAVVFCYVLYLVAKYDYKLSSADLKRTIKRWIYMSTVTSFYTGSTESEVEKQFADLRAVRGAKAFIDYIEAEIANRFTDDFFLVTLPKAMETSSLTSPAWFGYISALNILGVQILFGNAPLKSFLVPGSSGTKKSTDKHHIFPKEFLPTIGVNEDRDRNQIANFAIIEYHDNISITDTAPHIYMGQIRENIGEEQYKQICNENALPFDFEKKDSCREMYLDFLSKRRLLMAQKVKEAFSKL